VTFTRIQKAKGYKSDYKFKIFHINFLFMAAKLIKRFASSPRLSFWDDRFLLSKPFGRKIRKEGG